MEKFEIDNKLVGLLCFNKSSIYKIKRTIKMWK